MPFLISDFSVVLLVSAAFYILAFSLCLMDYYFLKIYLALVETLALILLNILIRESLPFYCFSVSYFLYPKKKNQRGPF